MTKESEIKTAYLSARHAYAGARNNYYVARDAYTLASDGLDHYGELNRRK